MADRRTIRYIPLDELQGNPANPKSHDLELIDSSLDRFGYVEPQTMDDRTGLLVAGHGRLEKLRARHAEGEPPPDGIRVRGRKWLVPVVFGWSSTDDDEALAYLVASNEATIAGGWDYPKLVPVLEQVSTTDLGLVGTGYTPERLDDILEQIAQGRLAGAGADGPAVPDPPADYVAPRRVERGDVWALGAHRLLCGDCRNPADVARVLDGATVNMAITSPPYADRRDYDAASGFEPIPPESYVEWFAPVAANVAEHLAPDGSWFVNIKAGVEGLDTWLYVLDLVLAHARDWGWHFATEFCWERGGMPQRVDRRFKNQFEPVYQFARGDWKIRPDAVRHESDHVPIPLGPGGGSTSWQPQGPVSSTSDGVQGSPGFEWFRDRNGPGLAYPGNRLPSFAGTHEAVGHGAAFPVGLPAWFCLAFTDPGDVVLDPFVGSGSTIIAAQQEGRVGYGIELSPLYCDMVLDRWERHDGEPPVKVDG